MTPVDWWHFFLVFLRASLLSTGGRGPFPYLYTDLLKQHLATEATFVEALTVGELSPGPSGLWVVSLGYLVAGTRGALLAAAAAALPPLIALVLLKVHVRVKSLRVTHGLLDGLLLAIAGSSWVVLARLFAGNGITTTTIVIAGVAAVLTLTRKVPGWAILGAAALAGVMLPQ